MNTKNKYKKKYKNITKRRRGVTNNRRSRNRWTTKTNNKNKTNKKKLYKNKKLYLKYGGDQVGFVGSKKKDDRSSKIIKNELIDWCIKKSSVGKLHVIKKTNDLINELTWWGDIPIILTSFCEKLNPLLGRVKLDASNKCEIDIEFLCKCFESLNIKFKSDTKIDNKLVYDTSKSILKSKNALNVNQIAQHFTHSIKTGESKKFIFVGSHSKLMTEICKQYLGETIKVEFDNLDILCIEQQFKDSGIWEVIKLYKLQYATNWLYNDSTIPYNTDTEYRYIFLIRHCIGCHNIFSGWQKIKAGTGPNPLTKYALCIKQTKAELHIKTNHDRYSNLISDVITIDNVGFWSSIVFRAILTTVMFGSNLREALIN